MAQPEAMNPGGFFAELKRRNVYKVAVAYAVASWLLIQIATQVFPFFEIPNWAVRLVVLILIAGFPVALVFSWAFEITPEGIKRESEVEGDKSVTHHTGRKIVALTIVLAVVAAGLMAYQFGGPKRSTSAQKNVPTENAALVSEKSIAVLPFENLSDDKSNAYFTEGIQDEILTRLAKVAELKVIARTSTQKFKSAPENLPEIAKQLGALNILEGSVQKVNDQVRVNVQLINAMTNAHLWAEIYDRKLTDIFAVESDIARTVAETLRAKLTGSAEQVLTSKPTENPEAHQLYLKGRYFWNRRTGENLNTAAGYFQQAIEKDPAYAFAYSGLADSYALLPVYGNRPPKQDIERAIAAARRAIELDDGLAEAHTSLANALVDDLQFAAAETEFKRAIALNPNYATAHQWFGESLQAQGRFDEAVTELKKAHELDPLSLIINTILASNLDCAGHHEEALQQIRRTIEMDPNFGVASWVLGQILEDRGDFEGATAAYEKAQESVPSPRRQALLACIYARTGKVAEARKILDELTARSQREYVSSYTLALIHVALGQKEEGLRLLEKAYDERALQVGGNTGTPKIDKRLDPLRDDPRFQKLLAKFMGQT